MKNIINCSCARYSDTSTITHFAKYRLIIVIEKKNRDIIFFTFSPYSNFFYMFETCMSSCECGSKTDMEDKKLLNEVVIFICFAHKRYSRSIIKLQSNHCYHMDYFINVLTTFLGLEGASCVAVYAGSVLGFHQKYLNLCSDDEQRLYEFGTT